MARFRESRSGRDVRNGIASGAGSGDRRARFRRRASGFARWRDGGADGDSVPFTRVRDFRDGVVVRFEEPHDPAGIRRVRCGDVAELDEIIALGLGFWRSAVRLAAVRLDGHDPARYVGGLLEEAGTRWYQAWAKLPVTPAEGTPQWMVPGDEVRPCRWICAAPERERRFRSAMAGGAMTAKLALPRRLRWSRYRTVADIGCCGGEVLAHTCSTTTRTCAPSDSTCPSSRTRSRRPRPPGR